MEERRGGEGRGGEGSHMGRVYYGSRIMGVDAYENGLALNILICTLYNRL